MLENVFYDLFDNVQGLKGKRQGDAFMETAKEMYGLSNIAYLGVNIPSPTHGNHYVQCTYSDEWIHHYVTEDYVSIDPVVSRGLTGLLPLDWGIIPKRGKRQAQLFHEAKDIGVGSQGLTFPIRGRNGETAIFSINADVPDKEWKALKKIFMRDMQIIAHFFHNSVLISAGQKASISATKLTPRELECLKWAANGKSAWETSVILSISQRTVGFHLDQARHKLNCLTKTQAVAKAIATGLVNIS